MIKVDRSAVNFYSRLNSLYYQFQGVANNYNQVVHAMHREFSPAKVRATIVPLVAETRELKKLCEKIVTLVDQFNREYLDDSQHHPDGAE